MKTTTNTCNESIYSLLVRSEEKERNLSETAVYLLLALSTVFSIWQFAQQPLNVPANGETQSAPIAQAGPAPAKTV